MRHAHLISITIAAACITSCAPSPPPKPHVGTPTGHDSLLARAYLEDEGLTAGRVDSLFLAGAALDSVTRAVAAFRTVDTALTRVLGDSSSDMALSRISVAVGLGRGADSVLADSLLRCAAAGSTSPVGEAVVTGHVRRLPRGCWSQLDAALNGLPSITVGVSQLFKEGVSLVVVQAPMPLNRETFSALIKKRTGHGVVGPVGGITYPLVRSDSVWTFTFDRGYGDCPSGCAYHRFYAYRYSPRTGRAWKHGEYGDPWPPPKGREW